jgi:hypothetical protein
MMSEEEQDFSALTALERAVVDAAIAPDSDVNTKFGQQVERATVTVRTPSGVGFVTKLSIPDELAISEQENVSTLPTITGEHPHLRSGAEFVLQVKGGKINSIEAFCFEGLWPDDESQFTVRAGT